MGGGGRGMESRRGGIMGGGVKHYISLISRRCEVSKD